MKAEYLLYFCDGMGPIFHSQVMSLLRGISERDVFKKICLFLGIRNGGHKNSYLKNKSTPKIEAVFSKAYPNYSFLNSILRWKLRIKVYEQLL